MTQYHPHTSVVSQAVTHVQRVLKDKSMNPTVGIILGSGLGPWAESLRGNISIPYSSIPELGACTAHGHKGNFVVGTLQGDNNVEVIAMQGRRHFYECNDMQVVVLGVRIMAALGVNTLIITNAAGGLNPAFKPGQFMLIEDHINEMGTNPLIGEVFKNEMRFPNMSPAYDRALLDLAHACATELELNHLMQQGTYAAVAGPMYETPAEARRIRGFGADAVGMSTVPEVIVARAQANPIRVLGMSLITNVSGVVGGTHAEVLDMANHRQEQFTVLLNSIIPRLSEM